jgi:hypothetical protein
VGIKCIACHSAREVCKRHKEINIVVFLCHDLMGCDMILKMEVLRSSKMLVSYHITIWCYNPEDHDMKTSKSRSSGIALRHNMLNL